MKNQYNFLKPIDTTSSSNATSNEQQAREDSRPQLKSGLSKFHNLVTSKLTASGSSRQLSQEEPARSKLISSQANKMLPTRRPTGSKYLVTKYLVEQQQQQQQQQQGQNCSKPSEVESRVAPELAECYDEIDIIYDFIRGLVPLPPHLRKIKYIDFEQLERDAKIEEFKQQQVVTNNKTSIATKPIKVRQRDASECGANDKLKEPSDNCKPQLSSGSGSGKPIKVTTIERDCTRPIVKRVESLNLNSARKSKLKINPISEFRLPRAQSTSNLNQQLMKVQQSSRITPRLAETSTLPARRRFLPNFREKEKLVEAFVDDSSSSSSGSSSSASEPTKSPSDYENDSSASSPSSSSGSSRRSASSSKSQTLSNRNKQNVGSQNKTTLIGAESTNKPSKKRIDEEEHIYEQIPALARNQEPRVRPHPQPARHQQRPLASTRQQAAYNYPVAFAAAKERQVYPNQQPNGTFPLLMPPMRQAPAGGFGSNRPAPLHLDHRHRLSMGNLHVLPYVNHPLPLSGAFFQPSSMNRASSSSRVNRAPRLSPGQLIAQIQMPRAVSKRQQENFSSSQFTASNHHKQLQRKPVFVWANPQANRNVISNSAFTSVASSKSTPKRYESRRNTAIGIEEALQLDYMRKNAPQTVPAAHKSKGAEAKELPRKRALGRSYFEPAQLSEAPLIDDEDEDEEEEDSTGSSKPAKLLAHQQAAVFIQNRCLNSISDLHSFSSITSEDDERSSRPSTSGGSPKSNKVDSNFVSSRSFIKCYYGKAAADKSKPRGEPLERKEPVELQAKLKKRNSGEMLLGLIGLNTSSAENKENKKKRQQVPKSSNYALQTPPKLPADLLNPEGPILVRDRRLTGRHYEHPTVQVAKVPPSPSRSVATSCAAQLAGSTNTTNSTSSYEAAIKNSRLERAPQAVVVADHHQQQQQQQQRNPKKAPSAKLSSTPTQLSLSLIKVPKLSKQSHLLNRPLPKLPSSSGARPSRAGGATQQCVSVAPSRPTPLSKRQQAPPVAGHKSAPSKAALAVPALSQAQQHHSPTVTTCTSSGISSRLTAGASSSRRSAAGAAPSSDLASLRRREKPTEGDTFALMDDDDDDDDDDEDADSEKSAKKEPREQHKVSNNLRLFDQKFSANFLDQQLASSNDSLLESINFSGKSLAKNRRRPLVVESKSSSATAEPKQLARREKL